MLKVRKIMCMLRNGLYDLKQTQRLWHKKFKSMCNEDYKMTIFFIIVSLLKSSLVMTLLSCYFTLMTYLLFGKVFPYDRLNKALGHTFVKKDMEAYKKILKKSTMIKGKRRFGYQKILRFYKNYGWNMLKPQALLLLLILN